MFLPLLSLKRFAAQLALAMSFLCVQHAATLHWLSHSIESVKAKPSKGTTANDSCDECLAFSALASGATSERVPAALTGTRHETLTAPDRPHVATATIFAFQSRAPPVLS
jgi:hypothetical protein